MKNVVGCLEDTINMSCCLSPMSYIDVLKMFSEDEKFCCTCVFSFYLLKYSCTFCMPTDYGLDGPGIESRWERDFPPVQTGSGANPASCTMGTGSFPGVQCGRGVLLTTHLLLAPRSWKSRAIYTSASLWATTGPVTGLL